MNTVLSTALSGLNSALTRVNDASARIAQGGNVDSQDGTTFVGGESLPQDIVDLKIGELAFKANAKVIETAHDMSEELLKTFDEKV